MRARPAATRRGRAWRWLRRLIFLGLLLSVVGVSALWLALGSVHLPSARPDAQTTLVFDAQGGVIAKLHGAQDRTSTTLEQVPLVMRQAVIAAEDRKFYRHKGVDPVGIARALWADVRGKGALEGGSTITQQYVKNAYLTSERTLSRKVKEAALAVKLERTFSKDEILQRYLNTIYFGRGAYGIVAAARAWFGKDVTQLGLPEAAYLAAVIRSPEGTDVSRHAEVAQRRRRSVLDAMVEEHYITAADRDAIDAQPIASYTLARADQATSDVTGSDIGMDYVVDEVRRQLIDTYGESMVYGGGLRVSTTIDPGMQRTAYEAVCGFLNRPGDPAGALVSIDAAGAIKAMVGGCDHRVSKVNLALGKLGGGSGRQAGSTFKPIVLAQAIRDGYSVESGFPAPAQVVIPKADGGKDWVVNSYEGESLGTINLITATVHSNNPVYAQLITSLDQGPQKTAGLAHRLGVTAALDPVPSIVLGTQPVSVLDMASAYSTFADRGMHIKPRLIAKVYNVFGALMDEAAPASERVLTTGQADLVNTVLQQVVTQGTGTGAAIGQPVAGKTGTTQDYGDAWFVGYTPKLTTAVWMGFPEGSTHKMTNVRGRKVTGGSFPAQIWRAFMSKAVKGLDQGSFVNVSPPYPGRTFAGGRLGAGASATTVPPPTTAAPATTAPPAPVTTLPPTNAPTTSPPPPSSSTASSSPSSSVPPPASRNG